MNFYISMFLAKKVSNPYRYSTNLMSGAFCQTRSPVSNPYRYSTNNWVVPSGVHRIKSFKPLQVFYKHVAQTLVERQEECFKPLQVFYKLIFYHKSNISSVAVSNPYRYSTNFDHPSNHENFHNVSNPYRYSTNKKISMGSLVVHGTCFKPLQVFYKQHCFWLYLSF